MHELLIRVTADLAVQDGSRIGDLGINFREIASRLFERHLAPRMGEISAVFTQVRGNLRIAIETTFSELAPAGGWDAAQVAECERRAAMSAGPQEKSACGALARVMSALFASHGRAWGTRELIVSMAADMACNDYGKVIGCCRGRSGRSSSTPRAVRSGQEHIAAAAEEARGRRRR